MITEEYFDILLPHVTFTNDIRIDGYIVSINRKGDEIFFQIEGSLKEVKTYSK